MSSKTRAQIFIADDDADDREFIINALERNGFDGDLVQFENGQLLSNYLQRDTENQPDLILIDLNMPVKNGFDTLRELKDNANFTEIPIIVLTASTKEEDEQICLKIGCDHFLSKPLDMEGYNNIARFVSGVLFANDKER
jgi:CheY-like chemotaxis protein